MSASVSDTYDSAHLPECPNPYCDHECPGYEDCTHRCICPALRRCEQRVEEAMDRTWTQTVDIAVAHTRVSTLDAARKAVVAQSMACRGPAMPGSEFVHTESIIAAIDALKEEGK